MQPYLERLTKTQTLLSEAELPGAQARAKWDARVGEFGPASKDLGGIIGSVLNSATGAAKAFAKPRATAPQLKHWTQSNK